MDALQTVSGWLAEIGRPLGVPIGLDEGGAAGLVLEGGLNVIVEVEPVADALHLHAELLRLPADARARAGVLETAMELNLHARRTEGATLGLDRRSDAVVLSITQPVSALSADSLQAMIAAFGEVAPRLRAALAGPPAAPAAESVAARPVDPRLLA